MTAHDDRRGLLAGTTVRILVDRCPDCVYQASALTPAALHAAATGHADYVNSAQIDRETDPHFALARLRRLT